jgi:hypothetical protein
VLVKTPACPRGVTWGDGIEIAGVFVVLGLYAWIAAALAGSELPRSHALPLLFFLAFTGYALGHGMHVAANSIHDMMAAIPAGARDVWGLAHFWDERMGHVPVDLARILFVVALLRMEREVRMSGVATASEAGSMPGPHRILHIAGAAAYGFIYFATAVEGQTVLFALPFCVALAVYGVAARSTPPSRAPVRAFFVASAFVSLLLFAIWGFWQRGFPEFTRAGIL